MVYIYVYKIDTTYQLKETEKIQRPDLEKINSI